MIGRLGDPFLSTKGFKKSERHRKKYEGMGLGLFIAKTLLERTGAEVLFSNGKNKRNDASEKIINEGAIVEVLWPRNLIEASEHDLRSPLPKNTKN